MPSWTGDLLQGPLWMLGVGTCLGGDPLPTPSPPATCSDVRDKQMGTLQVSSSERKPAGTGWPALSQPCRHHAQPIPCWAGRRRGTLDLAVSREVCEF